MEVADVGVGLSGSLGVRVLTVSGNGTSVISTQASLDASTWSTSLAASVSPTASTASPASTRSTSLAASTTRHTSPTPPTTQHTSPPPPTTQSTSPPPSTTSPPPPPPPPTTSPPPTYTPPTNPPTNPHETLTDIDARGGPPPKPPLSPVAIALISIFSLVAGISTPFLVLYFCTKCVAWFPKKCAEGRVTLNGPVHVRLAVDAV